MTTSRIPLYAAAAAAAAWTTKAVAIGLAGGLGLSPAESPLFFTGFACFVVGTVATGVVLARGRSVVLRVVAGALALVTGVLAGVLVEMAVGAVQPASSEHWVWSEVGLWVLAAMLLAVTAALPRRAAAPAPADDRVVATAS